MRKPLNKIYTNEEYKNMSQETLIETFRPLIKNLTYSYSEGRFNDDVEQEVIMELLKRQKLYNPELGYFPAYITLYLRMAAKVCHQINYSPIYVPYSSMIWNASRGKQTVVFTEQIKDHEDDESLSYYDEQPKESQEYSVLKIILTQLKKSSYSKEKKLKIRNYLKNFIAGDTKNNVIINKYIKVLCKGTVLDKIFNK